MTALKIILYIAGGLISLELLFLLFIIICSLFVSTKKDYRKNNKFYRFLLNFSTAQVIFFGRIKIHLTGKEKIPENTRFLLVCNHRSKFDPITTWYALKKYDLAFVSKPENFKVFCFGRIIRKCCFMAINRNNPKLALITILKAIDLIKKDEVSVCIYPEGTRTTTGFMAPLKSGSFKIAEKTKVPVVIMTAKDTEKICKNWPWKKTDIYLDILDVLSSEQVSSMNTIEMSEYSEKLMKKNMGEIE